MDHMLQSDGGAMPAFDVEFHFEPVCSLALSFSAIVLIADALDRYRTHPDTRHWGTYEDMLLDKLQWLTDQPELWGGKANEN